MTCASATFPNASPFAARTLPPCDARRILGGVAISLGTVTGACLVSALVTTVAAWTFSAVHSTSPFVRASTPPGPLSLALDYRYPVLAGVTDRADPIVLAKAQDRVAEAPPASVPAQPEPTEWTASIDAPPAMEPPRVELEDMRPMPTLPLAPDSQPAHEIAAAAHPRFVAALAIAKAAADTASAALTAVAPAPGPAPAAKPAPQPAAKPAPQLAAVAPPAELHVRSAAPPAPPLSYKDVASLPGPESRTAVYDIAAHTVYLPNGEKLEAHSGVGWRLDDPRYVNEKNRGPTPPNVYGLALRGELFHGVRAIRLNPVGDASMFGRDGILAHTYMLGPSGQSFGCVSFKDYGAFLRAFQRGEVDHMVVVPHLGGSPETPTVTRHRHRYRYAFDG